MADLPGNSTQPGRPTGPKRELSMEMRLLLAFVLMGLVLFLMPYFYKPPAGPKATAPAPGPAQATEVTKPPKAAAPATVAAVAPASGNSPVQAAAAEQPFTVDTDLYHIEFSNRGAVVRSWMLKKYLDSKGKPLELVNQASFARLRPPFSVLLKDGQPASINDALYIAKPEPDGLGIDYEYASGGTVSHKSFRFAKNSYLSQVTSELTLNGQPAPHLLQWRGGFGDTTVLNRATAQQVVYYDLSNSKLLVKTAKDAKNGPVTSNGNFSFEGLEDTFFAAVFLPRENSSSEVRAIKDDVKPNSTAAQEEAHAGVAVGGESANHFQLFVGPKSVDILARVDPRLPQLIDWGFFGIIARPLFAAMHWLNDNAIHNYGWSIVVITVIINLLLLPLRFTSMKSAKKMQALQPAMQAIRAKYKSVGIRDPRKAQENQEVMELYKKNGVNPMGGCLPMVVQIPILYAFYKVLSVTIEMRGAHWLWVSDLSQPEQLPLHLLPLILIVTQFLMQKMTPNPSMDPAQARMMMFMPLMFGFFFYNMSSGLVLYWLTGNLVGILQQWLMNRTMPAPAVEAPRQPVSKKKVSKS